MTPFPTLSLSFSLSFLTLILFNATVVIKRRVEQVRKEKNGRKRFVEEGKGHAYVMNMSRSWESENARLTSRAGMYNPSKGARFFGFLVPKKVCVLQAWEKKRKVEKKNRSLKGG